MDEDNILSPSNTNTEPLLESSSHLERRPSPTTLNKSNEEQVPVDENSSSAENIHQETINEDTTSNNTSVSTRTLKIAMPNLNIKHKILLLILSGITLGAVLPKNTDLPTPIAQYTSSIIGYTYFLCWSVSFYPQIILNHKRKHTTGLSSDFSVLNVVGFGCYSIYVLCLFWSSTVREQYQHRFHNQDANTDDAGTEPDTDVAVQSNDVAFAIHAFILSCVQLGQIIYYQERRRSTCCTLIDSLSSILHIRTKYFLSACFMICIIYAFCVVYHIRNLIFLDYLYLLSSIKLIITIIKYIPQAVLNYQRKSTVGWNIWNVLLDFSGGLLSLVQLVVDASAMNDFSAITGNFVKFGLSFVSLFFDVVFLTQHYILYPHVPQQPSVQYEMLPGEDETRNNVV